MLNRLKAGWKTAQRHPWIITMLFLYQFVWGFFLYRFVQSVVLPLLYRYPGEVSPGAAQVFLVEGQFRLLKTDVTHFPLGVLLAIIIIRMILTPLFNAGIYYSIHHDEDKQIRPFITGVRTLGLSVRRYLLYSIDLYCPSTVLGDSLHNKALHGKLELRSHPSSYITPTCRLLGLSVFP